MPKGESNVDYDLYKTVSVTGLDDLTAGNGNNSTLELKAAPKRLPTGCLSPGYQKSGEFGTIFDTSITFSRGDPATEDVSDSLCCVQRPDWQG